MNKAREVFGAELNHIMDSDVRDFVIDIMDTMAPDYFWTCPASMSGKYHPGVSLGEGGLVRHTKLAVWWGVELMQTESWMGDQRDTIIAALLLHDLKKSGEPYKMRHHKCVHYHGVWLVDDILKEKFSGDVQVPSIIWNILEGIKYHMGKWSYPDWQDKSWYLNSISRMCRIIHLADYCASRKADAKCKELLVP
ncbi:MAG: HD domain-containing protein [Candidatus Aegiribacteria sp.]|nr:HD domain-containing protein [Candidatus Aegiribacteria sp.]